MRHNGKKSISKILCIQTGQRTGMHAYRQKAIIFSVTTLTRV